MVIMQIKRSKNMNNNGIQLTEKGYKYQVVSHGNLNTDNKSLKEIISFLKVRGVECNGVNINGHNREELQGQPMFNSLLGPMYNGKNKKGEIIIRYETQKVYNELSV